jgi:hypothetical protein
MDDTRVVVLGSTSLAEGVAAAAGPCRYTLAGMGSALIASWIAHAAFWMLLVYGWMWDEIGPRGAAVFLTLWVAGLAGLPLILGEAAPFSSFVAVLDIALVFLIFKGDLRLS